MTRVLVALSVWLASIQVAVSGDLIRLWPVEVNGKWGYIDEHGKMAIEPQFDSAGSFREGALARVRVGQKWGMVNWEVVRAPVEFDYVGSSHPLPVRKEGQWAVWTGYYADKHTIRDTLVSGAEYDSIADFYGREAVVRRHGKWGVIEWEDTNGQMKLTIPTAYEALLRPEYNPDFASLRFHVYAGKRDGKWGLISDHDSLLIPFVYDTLITGTMSRFVAAKVKDKWGYVDIAGTVRIEPQYEAARGFERGIYGQGVSYGFRTPVAAVSREQKWGFIDTTGREIVPLRYQDVGRIGYSLTAVRVENKWGYLDTAATLAIPARFDSAGEFGVWGVVKVGDQYGFINDQGRWMISPEFEAVERADHSGYIVRKQGRYGFVIPRGQKTVIGWYDEVSPFYAGLAGVKYQGRWAYVGIDGKIVWQSPMK
jgi:hypothetical protein